MTNSMEETIRDILEDNNYKGSDFDIKTNEISLGKSGGIIASITVKRISTGKSRTYNPWIDKNFTEDVKRGYFN